MKSLPNILSLSRIVLLAPISYFLSWQTGRGDALALVSMFVAVATDWLDGYAARHGHGTTNLGRVLDPVADKIGVAWLSYLLVIYKDLPLWFFGLVVGRDVLIMLLALVMMKSRPDVPESNWFGKFAVGLYAATLICFTVDTSPLKWIVLWSGVALALTSAAIYLKAFTRTLRQSG